MFGMPGYYNMGYGALGFPRLGSQYPFYGSSFGLGAQYPFYGSSYLWSYRQW